MMRLRQVDNVEVAVFDAVFVVEKYKHDAAIAQARQCFYDDHISNIDDVEDDLGVSEDELLDIYDMPESEVFMSINKHYGGLCVSSAGIDVDKLYFHEVDGNDKLYTQDLIDTYVLELIDGLVCEDLNERYPNKLHSFKIGTVRSLPNGNIGVKIEISKVFNDDAELSELL